eukprot:CAMPEP_0195076730 /NCGR_PEP_ID=MMETSP0448-20130528/19318_1 /TAXON_ID=66468 /ORGANISM="Heterocapsa triquestra, Strain CCMP 448" /LENGTH=46 /DNA_ID= /DNA_START= /DNA_END= /DNA_ORIENTATION=
MRRPHSSEAMAASRFSTAMYGRMLATCSGVMLSIMAAASLRGIMPM